MDRFLFWIIDDVMYFLDAIVGLSQWVGDIFRFRRQFSHLLSFSYLSNDDPQIKTLLVVGMWICAHFVEEISYSEHIFRSPMLLRQSLCHSTLSTFTSTPPLGDPTMMARLSTDLENLPAGLFSRSLSHFSFFQHFVYISFLFYTFHDQGIYRGRDGKGSIFVWASGNGGRYKVKKWQTRQIQGKKMGMEAYTRQSHKKDDKKVYPDANEYVEHHHQH